MADDKNPASGTARDDPQAQPLTAKELQEENAATSLDQPSDDSS